MYNCIYSIVTIQPYFMWIFAYGIVLLYLSKADGACTNLPLIGTWIYNYNDVANPWTFTTTSLSGFTLSGKGTSLSSYDCIASNSANVYVLKSTFTYSDRGNDRWLYLCMKITKVSDSLFYFYFLNDLETSGTVYPKERVYNPAANAVPSDDLPACDYCKYTTPPPDNDIRKLQKQGTSEALPGGISVCLPCSASCDTVECGALPTVDNSINMSTGNKSGDNVTYTCSSGFEHSSGNLSRTCQGDGSWSGASPVCETYDISPVTEKLKYLTTVSVDNNNVHDIVGQVKNLTDPTIFKSIDIISVAEVLANVSKLPSIDERVFDDIFDIIDSVINVNVSTLTKAQDKGSATNRLLEVVNAVSTSLDIGQKTVARFLRDNILMDVYDVSDMKSPVIGIQINTGEFEALSNSTVKTIMSAEEVKLKTTGAAIILPVELIGGMNKSTRVALNVYRNWNLFGERSDIKQYDPNSRIVAASIIQDGRPVHSLEQYKVRAFFYPRMETGNTFCGYWDYDLHEKSGGWATDGCVLNRTESGLYVCICDHLTNFAILVNIGGQDTLVDSLALKIISYIGLILSIISLSLTVLSFILLKHLRKGRGQQTLANLAFSLFCFLIVFISGVEQTHDFYICLAIAVLLHYFILVAFMWMLMEGILQYLRFVKVLGTYIPRFMLKTAAPAWGVPLIPVIIVLALDHKLYHGGSKACWMSLSAFYYSFVVPVSVIVLANIIIFIMILKNLLGRPKGLTSNKSEKKRATMNLRAALSVLVLLGLTWIFGFFTIDDASVVFQYIFTILNVFQGFLIFVLFTAREKQVRHGWKQLCCRKKPREMYLKTSTSSNKNNTELTGIDFSMSS